MNRWLQVMVEDMDYKKKKRKLQRVIYSKKYFTFCAENYYRFQADVARMKKRAEIRMKDKPESI